jgi:hypothetical protein
MKRLPELLEPPLPGGWGLFAGGDTVLMDHEGSSDWTTRAEQA